MNRASNKKGSSTGVVLQTPNRLELEKAVVFNFHTSNNEVEYEAIIINIKLAKVYGATVLKAYCDSQLVVIQVQGEFKIKEASIKSYCTIVQRLVMVSKASALPKLWEKRTSSRSIGQDGCFTRATGRLDAQNQIPGSPDHSIF